MSRRPLLACTPSTAIAAAWLLLSLPISRTGLEATMRGHLLIQVPLLVAIGALAAGRLDRQFGRRLCDACGGAAACFIAAACAAVYWMMPRTLDAAIGNAFAEAAKFVSLPLLVGLPAALAWKQLGTIGRNFIKANLISMLGFVGWLYLAAPVRICNNYLLDEQARTGWLMVGIAVAIFTVWLLGLFAGPAPNTAAPRDAPDPAIAEGVV